jgi:hypothetical protein
MKAVTLTFLLWIAGIMVAIAALIIIWTWLLSLLYGSCWADARTELRDFGSEIEGGIRGPSIPAIKYRLDIGGCIAGVVFVNGRNDTIYSTIIEDECSEYSGYRSYMIAIPREFLAAQGDKELQEKLQSRHDEVEEQLGKKLDELKKTLSAWDVIKLYIKKKMGKIPPSYCYEFEHDFTAESIKSIPEGFPADFNAGGEPICLQASPRATTAGGFNYYITTYTCPPDEPPEELARSDSGQEEYVQ